MAVNKLRNEKQFWRLFKTYCQYKGLSENLNVNALSYYNVDTLRGGQGNCTGEDVLV